MHYVCPLPEGHFTLSPFLLFFPVLSGVVEFVMTSIGLKCLEWLAYMICVVV